MKALLMLTLLLVSPAHASSICEHMKATDTLILHGRRQHAERFVECSVGHWPDVDSVYRKVAR